MISLAAVIGILIIVVMIGFLGNCIRAVQQKIEIQNAADAAAYSSALWMARGMNAVTATNHMIGELSALCVLHEAIGGPELDDDEAPSTTEFTMYNQFIKNFGPRCNSDIPPLLIIDMQLLDRASETISDGDEDAIGGAMLYDSRATLKWISSMAVVTKVVAKVLEKTGFLTGLALAMHAGATAAIAESYKEYLILRYLQKVAGMLVEVKHGVEDQIIPLMVEYEKSAAGESIVGGSNLATQISDMLDELKERNAAEVAISPAARKSQLPIEPEAAPRGGGGGDVPSTGHSTGLPPEVNGLLKNLGVAKEVRSFLGAILDAADLGQIDSAFNSGNSFANGPPEDGSTQNPTRDKVKELSADWEEESTTQWTRATYPYVDSGRAPVVSTLEGILVVPLSKAGTYYTHWTNRFTLVKTWQFRKGERFGRPSAEPLALYVMRDSKPLERGSEPWTRDNREAERLFTLTGFARRDVETLFSPRVYSSPEPKNWVATAQAILYNANEQQPGTVGSKGTTQPVVGWNTLNWADPSQVPEYGAEPSEDTDSNWFPWSGLIKGWKNPPAVKLNWQAKLVPVTRTRLDDSTSDSELPQNFRRPVSEIIPFTSDLDAH